MGRAAPSAGLLAGSSSNCCSVALQPLSVALALCKVNHEKKRSAAQSCLSLSETRKSVRNRMVVEFKSNIEGKNITLVSKSREIIKCE